MQYVGLLVILSVVVACTPTTEGPSVLIFSKTEGYRHESIEHGAEVVKELGANNGFAVVHTEDATEIVEENLKNFHAVIFLSTTMDVLNSAQQADFERYIQSGGGFVGIHAAADTEYDWEWYGKMVGGYFESHPNNPNIRDAEIDVTDKSHIATNMLPDRWARSDEWYNYKDINPDIKVLMNLDESTYEGGTNGDNHPIAWYHEYDGGRAFYTGGGHTDESFDEELFQQHLLGGIKWAMGSGKLDYSKAKTQRTPAENRFVITKLDQAFYEPMEMEIFDDGRIIFVERRGDIKVYDPLKEGTEVIHTMEVHTGHEDGLLGIALDPDYNNNNWIYLFYSPVGEEAKQHVSRFVLKGNTLDPESEKVLLEIPVQREECCHSAGSLEFGPDSNLYISVGDNTNPHQSDGYGPFDDRAGRKPFDAARSSSNTNDLRGKVLRIKPEADGTYSIPEGNLFAEGTENTRPEIYVMGCRNPFRIHIDHKTGYLYWGDVGPDANEDGEVRGPRGHDEVNQARKAGYFGWPFFNGDNKAYNQYDFATKKSGELYNAEKPMNTSKNNTGLTELPPAQKAFVWYPYSKSEEFPLVGSGGRNAMAGFVYHYDDYADAPNRFPKYYDGKLFIYDWMRGWIMAVTMDAEGNYVSMEPFLPSEKFNNAVDMIMHDDGSLYVIEYGTGWFRANKNARLLKIEYNEGNREPIVKLEADKIVGGVPLTVNFSAANTIDYDRDDLKYEWKFEGNKVQSKEVSPSYTFTKPGEYFVKLKVKDGKGSEVNARQKIVVGNEVPTVAWNIDGNKTFYWDNAELNYEVVVSDKEDSDISEEDIVVTIEFLERGFDRNEIAAGHQQLALAAKAETGKRLIEESDCKACHLVDEKSAGPAYRDVAKKYAGEPDIVGVLATRVIKGGGGVWGETQMSAHPQLSKEDAEAMVRYVLSLANETKIESKPAKGTFVMTEHIGKKPRGKYILTASYTDNGANGLASATGESMLIFQNPMMQFEKGELTEGMQAFEIPEEYLGAMGMTGQKVEIVMGLKNDATIKFKDIDLTGIKMLMVGAGGVYQMHNGGTMEVRLDAPDGDKVGELAIVPPATEKEQGYKVTPLMLQPTAGKHDIYFVFKTENEDHQVGFVDFVIFSNGSGMAQ